MPAFRGELAVSGVDLREEDEAESTFAGTLNFRLNLPGRIAVLGPGGGGRDRLGPVLAACAGPIEARSRWPASTCCRARRR